MEFYTHEQYVEMVRRVRIAGLGAAIETRDLLADMPTEAPESRKMQIALIDAAIRAVEMEDANA